MYERKTEPGNLRDTGSRTEHGGAGDTLMAASGPSAPTAGRPRHGGISTRDARVVVIGGGFGGLTAAQTLARSSLRVTVIDRKNHHTFQPLLYQVATTMLSPGQVASPIRGILRRYPNVEVLLADIAGIDLDARTVQLAGTHMKYDYLIVAAGASHSYFGHPEWESLAPGLKTVEDAVEIRRRVLLALELAERQRVLSPDQPMPWDPPAFVVVGGGPTGVELAGALVNLTRAALRRNFRAIDPARVRVTLLEAGPRILPTFPEDLSRKAAAQLRALGVEVRSSSPVTSVEPGTVRIGETILPSTVTLWAAGVAASPLGLLLDRHADRSGRVTVNPDLTLPGHPEVYVIGDMAVVRGADGKALPGLAAVAVQEGTWAARNIARDLRGRARLPFRYIDKGTLATIGRKAAVADFGRVHLSGVLAWLAWLFVHILLLVGFRNRLMVLAEWGWSYFTQERSSRLITGGTDLPGWSPQPAPEARPDPAGAAPDGGPPRDGAR
jgi:NADH:ubiquinone reductase (H+-translocating)